MGKTNKTKLGPVTHIATTFRYFCCRSKRKLGNIHYFYLYLSSNIQHHYFFCVELILGITEFYFLV